MDRAREVPRWEDQDFVGRVSISAPYESGDRGPLVAVVDYGLKANIIRSLRRRGARARVLPHTATAADVLLPDVAGVVLSPGPGDPARLAGPTALAEAIIEDGRPLLGICLGHQIVARATGAETRRLPVRPPRRQPPHRGPGHGPGPVTTQNHEVYGGRRVGARGDGFHVSQRNLNDGSVEAAPRHAAHRDRPVPPGGLARAARRGRGLDRFLERVRAVA
ncbi:MAG: gamma-glutamyl-gamma-aminobutyrate hydrolase family protein [Chloroflexota bacterium]